MKPAESKILFSALAIFLISGIPAITGCRRQTAHQGNVILITLDTQRADFISAYNPANASTPNIDAISRNGMLFENSYCLIPITLPSHASLFYSQPPSKIKNYNNGQNIRSRRHRPSFVQSFQKNRYTTAAFISLGVLGPQFGLNEGFDTYAADFPDNRWYLNAREINDRVFRWLEDNQEKKFFLWIHYSDPHDPYAPPGIPEDFQLRLNEEPVFETSLSYYEVHQVELLLQKGLNKLEFNMENRFGYNQGQFLGRMDKLDFSPGSEEDKVSWEFKWGWFIRRSEEVFFFKNKAWIDIDNPGDPRKVILTFRGKPTAPTKSMRDLYRQEVEYMDSEIGRLWEKLEDLALLDDTTCILAGDHGEGLAEYVNDLGDPHVGHIHYLYDVYMRIPLIFSGPGVPKGKKSSDVVSLLDVGPTLFKLLGFKSQPSFQGRNIFKTLGDNSPEIFQETHKPEAFKNRFALLKQPWHLILVPEDQILELYNLSSDPQEKANLVEDKEGASALDRMKGRLEEFARDVLKNKEVFKIDKKTEEMLRTLGYIK